MEAQVIARATEMRDALERCAQRNGGAYVMRLSDGAPPWMRAVVYAAHGGMWPDDFRYQMISDTLDAIADSEPECDLRDLAGGIGVPVYTSELTAWLASHNGRLSYLDAVLEDSTRSIGAFDALQAAYCDEQAEVLALVLDALDD